MALKTDIKKAIQQNTTLKVNKVSGLSAPRITPNNKWRVYKIEIMVKNA